MWRRCGRRLATTTGDPGSVPFGGSATASTKTRSNLDDSFKHRPARCVHSDAMIRILLTALLATTLAVPAGQATPRELFERARMLEESNQGLNEAIALYTQVAAQPKERQLAATAQLRVGLLC